ncbi:metal-dependent transcriptional regulator [bacterium]|jgi:DtxR family transcriptional regulator, Mn-dependent transcriptional regulator|nr:metal-dependent transcriptional regulator [bacterium]MBT6294043.1 metal-dependent transcriptional regulator [bacterium]
MKHFEDYLEIMYYIEKNNQKITSIEIAKELKVSKSSVSQMLRKLKKEEFINFEPYKEITLLEKGRNLGKKIAKNHITLEKLFTKIGVSKSIALKDIHGLEHYLSHETIQAIEKLNLHLEKHPLDNNTN